MKRGLVQFIPSLVFIAIGFLCVFFLSSYLERNRISMPESYYDENLSIQGKTFKGYALGAEGLLADWYWMQSLQYLGGKFVKSETETINLDDLRPLNPRLLHPYLDNAAELDPKFLPVYTFGATVLPAIDTQKAIELTQKGIAQNPDSWRLYQHLGYIYWKLGDYQKAAETYEKGSQVAGSPLFMRAMVAVVRTEGGSRDTARTVYRQMRDEAQDEQTRNNAEYRLKEIASLDQLEALRAVLKKFKETIGTCPASLRDIVPALRQISLSEESQFRIDAAGNLVDPSEVPYLFDRAACDVKLDPENTKLPIQ